MRAVRSTALGIPTSYVSGGAAGVEHPARHDLEAGVDDHVIEVEGQGAAVALVRAGPAPGPRVGRHHAREAVPGEKAEHALARLLVEIASDDRRQAGAQPRPVRLDLPQAQRRRREVPLDPADSGQRGPQVEVEQLELAERRGHHGALRREVLHRRQRLVLEHGRA